MTLENARKQFPHIAKGIIYLNNGSISPASIVARNAANEFLEHRTLESVEPHINVNDLVSQTKKRIANIIHTKAERIAFTHNTADGVSILASGIDWKEGDRVLLYKYEYPGNVYPYLTQRRHGVEIDFMEPEDYRITVDVLKKYVTPKTRVIATSFVQCVTGFRADVEAIGKFCKENNIIFAVDAIQGVPHSSIDVEKSNIDFLACGAHKWMLGIEGLAFVYISERIQGMIHQASMGASSVANPVSLFDFDTERILSDASRYENGTLNNPGIAALNASLQFLEEFGMKEIESRILSNSSYILSRLKTHGVNMLTSETESEHAGIVTFEIENADGVLERLRKKKIIARVTPAMGKKFIRLSPHFYVTEDELRVTMDTIFE